MKSINIKTNIKVILKVANLTKNDEPFYSKNAQLKILNLDTFTFFHSTVFFAFFSSAFF